MSKIITGFEFAILVAIIIGIIILLNVMEARRRINAMPKPEDDDKAKEDEALRRRMVHEADSYNESASMEPFCGEGKKKRERKQESDVSDHNLYSKIPYEVITPYDIDLSRSSSHSSYSGHGGSFDGSGSSGDWVGSGSGSSSNSDCSSSSLDSSSSSCNSSD